MRLSYIGGIRNSGQIQEQIKFNRTRQREMSVRDNSLSPLSRDPFNVGKFRAPHSPIHNSNPQEQESNMININFNNSKQNSIGEIVQPITHKKRFSYSSSVSMMANTDNDSSSKKINPMNNHSGMNDSSMDNGWKSGIIVNKNRLWDKKTKIGTIHRTPPKDHTKGVGISANFIEDQEEQALPEIKQPLVSHRLPVMVPSRFNNNSRNSHYTQRNQQYSNNNSPTSEHQMSKKYMKNLSNINMRNKMNLSMKKDSQEEEGLNNKSTASAIAMFRISKSNKMGMNPKNNSSRHQKISNQTQNISIGTTTNNFLKDDEISHRNKIGTIVSRKDRNTATTTTTINNNHEEKKRVVWVLEDEETSKLNKRISRVLNQGKVINTPPKDTSATPERRKYRNNSRSQQKSSFIQQVSLERSISPPNNSHSRVQPNPQWQTQTNNQNIQYQQPHPLTLSNSFLKTPSGVSDDIFIVDLRTSISKIKQELIESQQEKHVLFRIPQIFFKPPSPATTHSQLHTLFKTMFQTSLGISPTLVTMKKYVDQVIFICHKNGNKVNKNRQLCAIWNYSGKIYFGQCEYYNENDENINITKNGLGMQWLPSRYIYYGQWKNDKKEGYGVMKKANKEVYIGCWKKGDKQGWGKLYDGEGQLVQDGDYQGGKLKLKAEDSPKRYEDKGF